MNETQRDILFYLSNLWSQMPHLRFCQLVQNISGPADNFYMSDETFVRKIREFSAELDRRSRPIISQFTIEEVARYENC